MRDPGNEVRVLGVYNPFKQRILKQNGGIDLTFRLKDLRHGFRHLKTLTSIGPLICSWDHVTTVLLKILHIMGYNLNNARNGTSRSKIPNWPSLRSLALKSKLLNTSV